MPSRKRSCDEAEVQSDAADNRAKHPCISPARAEAWESMFEALTAFMTKHGHCRNLRNCKIDDRRDLGVWVKEQRKSFRESRLLPDRQQRLESVGFDFTPITSKKAETQMEIDGRRSDDSIEEEEKSDSWNVMFSALLDYKKQHGSFKVLGDKSVHGKKLYWWLCNQRRFYRNIGQGKSPVLAQRRLERLCAARVPGFEQDDGEEEKEAEEVDSLYDDGEEEEETEEVDYSPANRPDVRNDAAWDSMFEGLVTFHAQHGHFCVPRTLKHNDGRNLGLWVQYQRDLGRASQLLPELQKKLESIGFDFAPGVGRLARSMPHTNIEEASLTKAKQSKKGRYSRRWNVMFDGLLAFYEKHGHLNVAVGAERCGGRDLGNWVCEQRRALRESRLLVGRKEKLESIGFAFEPVGGSRPHRNTGSNQGASKGANTSTLDDDDSARTAVSVYPYYDTEERVYMERLDDAIAVAERREEDELSSRDVASRAISVHATSTESGLLTATKKIPKFVGTELLLSDDQLQAEVLPLFEARCVSSGSGSGGRLISAHLRPIYLDPASLRLAVVAPTQDVLESFLEIFGSWCTGRIRLFNYKCLLQTGQRFAVEIDSTKSAGASVAECTNYSGSIGPTSEGLMVCVKPFGQLASLIGSACTARGACVVRLGGFPCLSIARFKEILSDAQGRKVLLELAVEKGADLSGVPGSCGLRQQAGRASAGYEYAGCQSNKWPTQMESTNAVTLESQTFEDPDKSRFAAVSPSPRNEDDKSPDERHQTVFDDSSGKKIASSSPLVALDKGLRAPRGMPRVSPTTPNGPSKDEVNVLHCFNAVEGGSFLDVLRLAEAGGLAQLVDSSVIYGMLSKMKKIPLERRSRDLEMKEMLLKVYVKTLMAVRTSKSINAEFKSADSWSDKLDKKRRTARLQVDQALALRNKINNDLTAEERAVAWLSVNIRVDNSSMWRVATELRQKDLIDTLRCYEAEDGRMSRRRQSMTTDQPRGPVGQPVPYESRAYAADNCSRSWLTGERDACRRFASKGSCSFGPRCRYWHVQKELGSAVLEPAPLAIAASGSDFERYWYVKTDQSRHGKICYTAGYKNDTTKRVYYAEGGTSGKRDSSGVWWYPSQSEAAAALRHAMSVAVRLDGSD